MRFASLLLAASSLMAQNIKQEGSDWVRTDSGVRQVDPAGELQVDSHGPIVVHGVPGDRISYKLTQRAKVSAEDEAHKLLSAGFVKASPYPGGAMVFSQGSSPLVSTELELYIPRTLRVAGLKVSFYGDVSVNDFDGGLVVRTPGGNINLDGIKGGVSATSGGGRIHLGKIGGSIECSTLADSITIDNAGGQVNCQTAGGEIVVKEAGGSVWLSSEGGNISVGRAAGSVEAHAESGLIDVGQAGGTVIADTRAGSIQIGSARGVKAESAQGAVRLRGMSGPMNVSTAMGNILAELLSGMTLQDSSLMATSGDITVFIPSNLRISVMATSEAGGARHVVSDFSELRGQSVGFSRAPVVTGDINGGGPVLRINTGRGMIYLRKQK
jgi:DUF4097 and DUF4098 domain-containing protein YvlB